MDDHGLNKIEIPKKFHSFSMGKMFDRCIDCDKYLLDEGIEYFIEKSIKKYKNYQAEDVIFEYAICLECAEKVRQQMSRESLRNIEEYFAHNINYEKRQQIMQSHPNDPVAWISNCLINNNSIEELTEYQIYAHCSGTGMKLSHMPYMVSGAVLDQVADLLSNETLDILDDFMNRNFGPPPELKELLPKRRVVLV